MNYRRNVLNPKYLNYNNVSYSSYNPPTNTVNGWLLEGNQESLIQLDNNISITIIQDDGKIYTGVVYVAVYDPITDLTQIALQNQGPGTNEVEGTWYYSDVAALNGEEMRAYSLIHELSYNPLANQSSGSVLFSVGIKGVLS